MGEEAKVRHADEAIVIVNGGQIFVVREKKGSVKISELDSDNRDADRDRLTDESDIDKSSDSMRPFKILSMYS